MKQPSRIVLEAWPLVAAGRVKRRRGLGRNKATKVGVVIMVKVQTFTVVGEEKLHCASCEARVGKALKRIPGVRSVAANHQTQKVEVTFASNEASEEVIQNRLEALGYAVKREMSS